MIPHAPTPDWAKRCVDRIVKTDDPDMLDALMELLAAVAPTEDEEKYKSEVAWAAIDHAFTMSEHCRRSCRQHLGVAV